MDEDHHPRLAALYDVLDGSRDDLDPYVALAAELGAHRVLDVGCGTGVLALLLADRGCEVTGVDPASASLAVARGKPGAGRVHWVEGQAGNLDALGADLALMTANVAMFLDDETWPATLAGVHRALRRAGHLVLETRDPEARAWERWTRRSTEEVLHVPGTGEVRRWVETMRVDLPWVGVRWTFELPDEVLTSTSRLRYRGRDELAADLLAQGFSIREVRDAPDRPGRELVAVAVAR